MRKYTVEVEFPIYEPTSDENPFMSLGKKIQDKKSFLDDVARGNKKIIDYSKGHLNDTLTSIALELEEAGFEYSLTEPFYNNGETWMSLLLDDNYDPEKRGVLVKLRLTKETTEAYGEKVMFLTGEMEESYRYHNRQGQFVKLKCRQQLIDAMVNCVRV